MYFLPAYKDLQSREVIRNAAWQREGWDEVVYYTGQLKFEHSNMVQLLES